ncbi:hypothetical protein [Pseudoduganella chitinolytica]|uniref:DUF4424 domain-containing protein n=1 Tax=Pseudoduganella chitinolytica TaxID=34070 RepID=A0ABY8BGN0_9BURK|nr:hypothetical protein [Pseudoduganella chitinolytica]WEF35085.1 hypothetical protein PX653_10080 [Pseudoduganella chitinolytica]
MRWRPLYALWAACLLSPAAAAFEAENGVPLAIAGAPGAVAIEHIALRLDGLYVTIRTELHNDSGVRQGVAFYASTPLFGRSGVGEEHADKRFDELRVAIDGVGTRLRGMPQAYFRGHDITARLRQAGIDPLPGPDVEPRRLARLAAVDGARPSDWLGRMTYAWNATLDQGARSVHEVRYRSRPRFALDMLDSARFTQQVMQFCGDPASVARQVVRADPAASAVLVERHDIPLDYLALRPVSVSVTQPGSNWLGARPLATLACGLAQAGGAAAAGTIDGPEQVFSVLVISTLAPTGERHGGEAG